MMQAMIDCPNPDMGPEDIETGQIWTHDYWNDIAERDQRWRVLRVDRDTGAVELVLPDGDGLTGRNETVGNMLAHWTCRVR